MNRLRLWLRSVFFRQRLDREMQDEMERHIAQSTQRLMTRGLSEAEARRQARREFGHVDSLQEQARDARGSRWIESAIADLKFGLRHFSKTPLSTTTMIVLLALGIGINTGLFSVLQAFRTLPPAGISRNDRLVRIRGSMSAGETRRIDNRDLSYPELQQYAQQTQLFSEVAGAITEEVILSVRSGETNLNALASYVTQNFFRVLSVQPVLGAGLPALTPDDASPPVAIISHSIWDQQFGRAPDVIGKTITVNDVTTTIVGVAPPAFIGPWPWGSRDRLWLPLNARAPLERSSASALAHYDSALFAAIALLRPGLRKDDALPTVQTLAGRAAEQTARRRATTVYSADLVPLLANNHRIESQRTRNERLLAFGILSAIGLFALLITCTNVSTLLVGLAVARRREIAVRLSLGAPRRRIVRQLITESIVLSGVAGGLAIAILWLFYRAFGARFPDLQLVIDWTVVGFTFGFAALTGIVFGTSPALHATRLAVSDVLKNSAASVAAARSRLQSGLVVAQIACTQPLLVGLGTMILAVAGDLSGSGSRSLNDRTISAEFNTWAGDFEEHRENLRRLQERVAALPAVVGVVQQSGGYSIYEVTIHPADRVAGIDYEDRFRVRTQAAPPGYFKLFDTPIIRGRDFTAADAQTGNPIVIGVETSNKLFGPADPIGRRLPDADNPIGDSTAFVVVGVVDDSKGPLRHVTGSVRVYIPQVRMARSLLVRTRGPVEDVIPTIRSLANAEAPNMPLTSARTLAAIEASNRTLQMQASSAAAGGGLLALFLSAIGLYAIVSFAVGQRTREIGIRTALGANRSEVIGLFFYRGLRLSVIGLAIGLPLSIIALRIISRMEGIVSVSTPLLATLIATFVTGISAFATWIPARRAAGIDPLNALRAE